MHRPVGSFIITARVTPGLCWGVVSACVTWLLNCFASPWFTFPNTNISTVCKINIRMTHKVDRVERQLLYLSGLPKFGSIRQQSDPAHFLESFGQLSRATVGLLEDGVPIMDSPTATQRIIRNRIDSNSSLVVYCNL